MTESTDTRNAAFTLSIVPDTDVALFHWIGPITMEDRTRNLERMSAFCEENGLTKLLIDGRDQENRTDFMDSYSFGTQVPTAFRGLQVAVVHRAEDDTLKFIETVAFNRASGTRSFTDKDEALAWLTSV